MGGIHRRCLRLFFFPALLSALAGAAPATAAEPRVEPGVVYCTPGGAPQRLDLARPAEGPGPFPAIVFVHGGAWVGGDRSLYADEIREHAARRGFVAATIDYRVMEAGPNGVAVHPWPAQIDDVRCAIRFLRANAARFAIDPRRIGATGHSAGGHLSLLAALEEPNRPPDAEWGSASSRVQAVVNQSGPTQLADLALARSDVRDLLGRLLPGPEVSFPERALRASPAFYVSPDDPPVLTLHGEVDLQVPVAQARALDAALAKVGVPHTLVILPGVPHAFDAATYAANRERIYAFFARALR